MQIPADLDPQAVEQAAVHWKNGSGIHAAAMDTGLNVTTVARLFALWDVVRIEARKARPIKPPAAPNRT